MDALKSGFKKLLGKSSFQGEPNVLGHAPSDDGSKPKPSSSTQPSQRPFSGQPHRLGTRPPPAETGQASLPTARPIIPPQARLQPREEHGRTSGNRSPAPAITLSPPSVVNTGPQQSQVPKPIVTEELQVAVALLCSSGEGALTALTLLSKILNNLRCEPANPKFGKLRAGNAKIGALLARPGAADVLAHAGFASHAADGEVVWEVQRPLEMLPRIAGALQTVDQAVATHASQPDSKPAARSDAASAPHDSDATPPRGAADVHPADAGGSGDPEAALAPAGEHGGQTEAPQANGRPGLPACKSTHPPAGTDAQQQPFDGSAVAACDRGAANSHMNAPATAAAPADSQRQQELGLSIEEWNSQVGKASVAAAAHSVGLTTPQELGISKEEWAARAKAQQAAAAAAAAPPEPFTGRNTQVLLPTQTDIALPDWFFARTPAEVRRDYIQARKKHEQERQLMTRAMRERLAAKGRKTYVFATIRVRFPEGYLLQGDFHQDEPVANVFAWVTFALREPLPFRLTSPALPGKQKTLEAEGTICSVQLMPSFLFNFQWDEPTRMGVSVPCLSDDALLDAKLQTDS